MNWRRNLILRRLRGESVEVPRVEPEAPVDIPSPIPVPAVPDTVLPLTDTLGGTKRSDSTPHVPLVSG